jgi:hypothetical protein
MDRDNSRTYDIIIIITLKSPTTYIVCTLLHENIHSCSKDCTFFGANNGNVAPSKIHTSWITSTTIPLKKGYWCFAKFAFPCSSFVCVCVCVCVCFAPFLLILAFKGQGNVSSTIKRFSSSTTTTRGGCWLACCIVKKRETFLPLPPTKQLPYLLTYLLTYLRCIHT